MEARREYTEQIVIFLNTALYDEFYILWKDSLTENSKEPMMRFQEKLEEVVDWDEKTMIKVTDRCIHKSSCKFLDNLITAVFVAHMKILLSIKNANKKDRYKVQVPTPNKFLYECMMQCSREFWKSPYLFYQNESQNKITKVQIQKNLRQAEDIISSAIRNTIRGMLPVKEILGDVIDYDARGDLILDIIKKEEPSKESVEQTTDTMETPSTSETERPVDTQETKDETVEKEEAVEKEDVKKETVETERVKEETVEKEDETVEKEEAVEKEDVKEGAVEKEDETVEKEEAVEKEDVKEGAVETERVKEETVEKESVKAERVSETETPVEPKNTDSLAEITSITKPVAREEETQGEEGITKEPTTSVGSTSDSFDSKDDEGGIEETLQKIRQANTIDPDDFEYSPPDDEWDTGLKLGPVDDIQIETIPLTEKDEVDMGDVIELA